PEGQAVTPYFKYFASCDSLVSGTPGLSLLNSSFAASINARFLEQSRAFALSSACRAPIVTVPVIIADNTMAERISKRLQPSVLFRFCGCILVLQSIDSFFQLL